MYMYVAFMRPVGAVIICGLFLTEIGLYCSDMSREWVESQAQDGATDGINKAKDVAYS